MKSPSRSKKLSPAHAAPYGDAAKQISTLEEAENICTQGRRSDYGQPLDNHQVTADLYNAYFAGRHVYGQYFVGPEEVCILNILQKVSRTVHGGYKRDTLVDIAGYAFNIELIQAARVERAG